MDSRPVEGSREGNKSDDVSPPRTMSALRHHQHALLSAHRRLVSAQRVTKLSARVHSSSPLPSAVCTSCAAPLPTRLPACPKCFHIERPVNKYDYYELLETPKSPNPFDINESQLKNNF